MSDQDANGSADLVIGSRGSDLALTQSRWVGRRLDEIGVSARIEIIKTRGDRIQDVPLASIEGKGFFTKEIEEALLAGRIDLAVHSLKDLPTASPPGLAVAAVPVREDPSDCLLVKKEAFDPDAPHLPLRPGTRVGTGSIRRQAQLAEMRGDLELVELRGNVPTRVRKLREGESGMAAVVLASAGLKRLALDLSDLEVLRLEPTVFLPAPGQGALALQTRADDGPRRETVHRLESEADARRVLAERLLLARLEGGCHLPLGAHAVSRAGGLELHAFLGKTPRWGAARRVTVHGSTPEEAAEAAFRALTEANR